MLARISYVQEDAALKRKGLRAPQIGAIHAAHMHWSVSSDPATIVMPTGTGKTDTMLSIFVSVPCLRLLVVVSTDALRTQIARKFLTLGILKEDDCRVLAEKALYPIVGTLTHIPTSPSEVDEFFEACQVIVTTSQIAGRCSGEIQARMASHCPYLFIDEAHHVSAPTWSAFKSKFEGSRVLQFTATPFREDGRPVEGKIVFKYPLRKAQEEGYFRKIRFAPVTEFDPAKGDEAVAARAVEQLREDHAHNHILMARVDSVDRAREVFKIYEKYPEFNPVQIHTGIKSARERERIRREILEGRSKIVVCVDMLGEGFDLPELKIAAFHNVRKGVAVTLQLAGRFTRSRPDLGDATFVANVADLNLREELRKLYTRDPDWNVLLPDLGDGYVEEQVRLREFVDGFANFPPDIPLTRFRPATSTAIYKTTCAEWTPEKFAKGIPGIASFERVHHDINYVENTLIVVTARKVPVPWAEIDDIYNWDWELYVIYWDSELKLLFINNSNNGGYFKALAEAVAGDVELVREQTVFRSFSGINRLTLQTVGLREQLGRLVRYIGRMGSDVGSAITDAQKRNTQKSMIFGKGYEDGRMVTVGASRQGRIWSFTTTNVATLVAWFRDIGKKVIDESIDPDEVLKGTLEPETVSARPRLFPMGVDWPEAFYKEQEAAFSFVFGDGSESALCDTEIVLREPDEDGDIAFDVSSDTASATVVLSVFAGTSGGADYGFRVVDGDLLVKRRAAVARAADFFYEDPPVIWFADGSSLEGNTFTKLKSVHPPFDRNRIEAWDWTGVDLTKESQGVAKESDSIQYKVIQELLKRDYDVVFDDDSKGEAADIVTVKEADSPGGSKTIDVEFYHCKFTKARAGKRIKDLYEVCGQAQRSVHWMKSHEKQIDLFTHLLRREASGAKSRGLRRLERGTKDILLAIREMSRVSPVRLKVFIVQPGLSQRNATQDQLELLSVTDNHLMEVANLPFHVIGSA